MGLWSLIQLLPLRPGTVPLLLIQSLLAILSMVLLARAHPIGHVILVGVVISIALAQRGRAPELVSDALLLAPPAWWERTMLLAAALVTGYSCFSFLSELAPLNGDTAEHGFRILNHLPLLDGDHSLLSWLHIMVAHPYLTLSTQVVKTLGWSIFSMRVTGAVMSFLTLPCVYLAVRALLNRGAAAYAALIFAGSLGNFTVSKLACWDASVGCHATLTFALVILSFKRRGWLALPALFASILVGLNQYEAYRLIIPVAVLVYGAAFFGRRHSKAIPLGGLGAIGLALLVQGWLIYPGFWRDLRNAQVMKQITLHNLAWYSENVYTKLYAGSFDNYFSESQGGLDHPAMIGLAFVGLALALSGYRSPRLLAGAAWLVIPLCFLILLEGQWRRGTAIIPVVSVMASLPFSFWTVALHERLKPSARLRYLALMIPTLFAGGLVASNVSRFSTIQHNRWGGLYVPAGEVAAAQIASQLLTNDVVLVFSDSNPSAWNFLDFLNGGTGRFFQINRTFLGPYNEKLHATMNDLIATAANLQDRRVYFFVKNQQVMDAFSETLTALTVNHPEIVRRELIPEPDGLFQLFAVGNLSD